MDGSPDIKGESILAIATLHNGVRIYNVDQSMAELGTLPGVSASHWPRGGGRTARCTAVWGEPKRRMFAVHVSMCRL
jgi:hypothetical protein